MIRIEADDSFHPGGRSKNDGGRPLNGGWKVAMTVVVFALLAGFCVLIWMQSMPVTAPPMQGFFFDESTGQSVVRNSDAVPPLPNAAGELTIVRAYYFTCGGVDQKWVGYLGKIDTAAQAQVAADLAARRGKVSAMNMGPPNSFRDHLLIRHPEKGSPWVHASSAEGQALIAGLKCPDGSASRISPVTPDEP